MASPVNRLTLKPAFATLLRSCIKRLSLNKPHKQGRMRSCHTQCNTASKCCRLELNSSIWDLIDDTELQKEHCHWDCDDGNAIS